MPRPRMNRAFLAVTAKQLTPSTANVVVLAERRSPFGVEVARDESGMLTGVTIRMPTRAGGRHGPSEHRLRPEWLAASRLALPFAEAVFESARNVGVGTQGHRVNRIHFFFRFLADSDRSGIGLGDLTASLFNEYIAWLDSFEDSAAGKAPKLADLRLVLGRLRKVPAYRDVLPASAGIRMNPWPGRSKRHKPRQALSVADLIRIERACLREMRATMAKLDEGNDLIASGRKYLADTPRPSLRRLDAVLAALDDKYGCCVTVSKSDIETRPLRLGINANGGLANVRQFLHGTARGLVPFVVMLAIRTAFNPETVLRLDTSAVRRSPLMADSLEMDGRDRRHKIVGRKNRARVDQVRTFPESNRDSDNPVVILENVARLTARLRPRAPEDQASRVFLFVTDAQASVRSFTHAGDPSYLRALREFIEENGLPHFTLAQIRPTISELVDLLSGGDLKAQQIILNHGDADTTDGHYVSQGARHRRNERLAEVQNRRERWIATGGARDTRQAEPSATQRAVTAGFECFDPYDSPLPGQVNGRLCTAWGSCATCPLGCVNPSDPHALARLVQLEHAIEAAKCLVPPQRWVSFWSSVLRALRDRWLPEFRNPDVWRRAEDVALPPLPPIE